MFRYCYLAAFGLLLASETNAVEEAVKDVRFRVYGDKVHIHYTLEGEGKYKVSLRLSDDGGLTFSDVPKSLSGAVGRGVKSGRNKEVIWDALRDVPSLEGSRFVFEVLVSRGPKKDQWLAWGVGFAIGLYSGYRDLR